MLLSESMMRIRLSTVLEQFSGEPDQFMRELVGDVQTLDEEDWCTVGSIRLYRAYVDQASRAGFGASDVFDGRQESACYLQLLEDDAFLRGSSDFCLEAQRALGLGDQCGDMLIIDRVEILPEFRGKELALHAIELAIAHYGVGCDFVAMKPYPLQFEADALEDSARAQRMGLDQLTQNARLATSKLIEHYGRIGFRLVTGTDLLVRVL